MTESANGNETKLLAEIDALKKRLKEQQRNLESSPSVANRKRKPTTAILVTIGLVLAVLVVIAFFVGYIPGRDRQKMLVNESRAQGEEIPSVNVEKVSQSSTKGELVLPGNIQAVTEAPVLARATGYLKRRLVDIGDRVKAGQLLAEVDAVEIEQQVKQAQAVLDQTNATLEQVTANLQQGKTNEKLAQITTERYQSLVARGAVSRQDADNFQAQFDSQKASSQSLEKAVNVAKSNVRVQEAALGRLKNVQNYLMVRAPFAGVITYRGVDVGALVAESNTLLFRVAQTDRLRTFVSVPQSDAAAIHAGQKSILTVPDLPNKKFEATVTRTANALDPTSRTLLTEVQLANPGGVLMPGMYAQVNLSMPRTDPPLLIPGDTLVVRANGPQVAVVKKDKTVHFQKITLGRDFGDKLEVTGGLEVGQQIIVNPGDRVREGAKVTPILAPEKKR